MKISSTLAGIFYGFSSMVLLPLMIVLINEKLHLPILQLFFIQLIGALFVVGGVLLLVFSIRLFERNGRGGSPLPFDPPHKLVTVGSYKYMRNPMFMASALIWFGEFLFFGSLLLLPYAVGWVLFNHMYLVLQDEKWLEERFGKEYIEYKKRTPRYVPRFR